MFSPLGILLLLSPAVLIMAITVIRILRAVRQTQELQERRAKEQELSTNLRRPADDFHDQIWLPLCTKVASAVAAKLQRPLTQDERRRIWRARSELALEIMAKEMDADADPRALLTALPSGLDRPDPTQWCRGE